MTSNPTATLTHDYLTARFQDVPEHDSAVDHTPFLSELLNHLKWYGDPRALRDALPHAPSGLGFTDFLNTLSNLGYAPKVMKVRSGHLNDDMVPCLYIKKGDRKKTDGELLLTVPDDALNGTVYIFNEHNNGIEDIASDQTVSESSAKWFTKLLYRFKGVFRQVLTASLIINLMTLVTPLFMMSVYDKVIGAHSPATLQYLLAGVILAVGVEFTLRFLRSKSLSWFGARIDYIVSTSILERLLSLPANFTERASVAAQLSRLKAFESVREFFTGPLFLSFIELPFTVILLAAIAIIGGPLVIIPLVIAALYAILLVAMKSRLKTLTGYMANANATRQNLNIETLGKQETLRYAGGFDAWYGRYEKASAKASYAGYRYNQAVAVIDTISQGLIILGGLSMIYFGVERIWAGDMSMGAMIALLILTWRSLAPFQMACTAMPRLDQVKRNIQQINRLMDITPEYTFGHTAKDAPHFKGEVEFHNVGLRYSKDADPVYAGLSFTAKQGQLVAITGSNSTGKSTTLKLISGLYQPQAGSVRIDGIDIRQIDALKLRQNISYVGQDPQFFNGPLADNMRLVRPDATDKDIIAALAQAGLQKWFDGLPDGLQSIIGDEKRTTIAKSMHTQLALARAYLQDTPIMLIDEMPYEFLNGKAGKDFHTFLKKQKGARTIFYITYRRDYLDLADITIQLQPDLRPNVKESKNAKK